MKYISANKLIAEIERRIQHAKDNPRRYPDATSSIWSLQGILSFIESLEKEEDPPRICPKCIHYKEDMCQEPYGGMTSKINRNGIYDCTAFIENTLFEVPPKIKGWVARDKRGTLNFFRAHPRRITDSRGEEYWIGHVRMKQPNEFFPDLKWEDELWISHEKEREEYVKELLKK